MAGVNHPRAGVAVGSEDVSGVGAEVISNSSAGIARSNFVVKAISGGRDRANCDDLTRVDHPRARLSVAERNTGDGCAKRGGNSSASIPANDGVLLTRSGCRSGSWL